MKERRSLTINIPDPCKQAWSDMAPVEDGRFCQHCQKKVIDFSAMTDKEIITTIHKDEGKLCGRFLPDQLGRTLVTDSPRRHSLLPAAMFASLIAAIIPDNSNAQKRVDTAALAMVQKVDHPARSNKPGLLKGHIVDSLTNEGLSRVTITIKGTSAGTISDADGKFRLILPSGFSEQTFILRISYLGYNLKELPFHVEKISAPVTIPLQKSNTDLDEIVVTSYGTKRVTFVTGAVATVKGEVIYRLTWWQRVTRVFRKKHQCAR